jgi:hypothetical protein
LNRRNEETEEDKESICSHPIFVQQQGALTSQVNSGSPNPLGFSPQGVFLQSLGGLS